MRLPQELIDQVINYHEHDRRTLRVCSLVSSSWTRRAQRHLFDRLYYSKHAYVRSGSLAPPGFPVLLSFLRSTPVVCEFVHELTLDGNRYWGDSYITPPLFVGIVDSLPHLGEVTLQSLSLRPNRIGDTSLTTDTSNRSRMTRPPCGLTIRDVRVCGDRPFETMHRFLRSLHHISSLTVDNIYHEDEDPDDGVFDPDIHQSQNAFFTQLEDWPAARTIEHLAFSDHRNMSAIFMALLQSCDMRLMKSLRAECFNEGAWFSELKVFFGQTVVASIARTLQYLVVEIGQYRAESQHFPIISGLSVLRSLEFRMFQGTCSVEDFDTSLEILSTRPPTCIRVKYDFLPARVWLLKPEHWRRLEEVILMRGEVPREFRLVLKFIGRKRSSDLAQKLHSGLPQLSSRGLVEEIYEP